MATIFGTEGNDHYQLYGTEDDTVYTYGGGDIVVTYGGDDLVYAGESVDPDHPEHVFSYDEVDGGDGNDVIYGEGGIDFLIGGGAAKLDDQGLNDNDWLDGGAGDDALAGGFGTNTLVGGAGADIFSVLPPAGSMPRMNFPMFNTVVDFSSTQRDRIPVGEDRLQAAEIHFDGDTTYMQLNLANEAPVGLEILGYSQSDFDINDFVYP